MIPTGVPTIYNAKRAIDRSRAFFLVTVEDNNAHLYAMTEKLRGEERAIYLGVVRAAYKDTQKSLGVSMAAPREITEMLEELMEDMRVDGERKNYDAEETFTYRLARMLCEHFDDTE